MSTREYRPSSVTLKYTYVLEVEGVEVQADGTTSDQLLTHLCADLYTRFTHLLLIILPSQRKTTTKTTTTTTKPHEIVSMSFRESSGWLTPAEVVKCDL
jgi:hypothetical protein